MSYKLISVVLCFLSVIVFIGCSNSSEPVETTDSGSISIDTSTANTGDHEVNDDYTWNEADVIPVSLNGNSVTANNSGVSIEGTKVTISAAGVYKLTGTLTDGQVIVSAPDDALIRLIFDGVNIACSNSAPVYIKGADKTIIILQENSENVLTDAATYVLENTAADEPNAALYSKSDLTIYGTGALTVTGNYNDGIASIDGLIVRNGNIIVNSADDGIRGKDYLIIKDGDIKINAKGDGLSSDNDEDASKGYISIDGGSLNVISAYDGISARTDVIINDGTITVTSGGGSSRTVASTSSAKALKGLVTLSINGGSITASAADDAFHSNGYVIIKGGTSNISSADDGIHADASVEIDGGELNITKSVEGIESPGITVNKGTIHLVSSDDGFNATAGNGGEQNDNSKLSINGGFISVNSSKGDGLDSNGSIEMTGGTVVVHGPQSPPEVGTDYNGAFNISGGMLVLTGPNSGNMIEATSTSSSQNTVKASSGSSVPASTLFHVQDESGNDVLTFKPVRNFYYVVFSSPSLQQGATYYIYTGGTSTGTEDHGYYTGGTYTPGTQKKSFTVSGRVTNVTF